MSEGKPADGDAEQEGEGASPTPTHGEALNKPDSDEQTSGAGYGNNAGPQGERKR